MIEDTLSHYTGVAPAQLARILKLTQTKIYEDQEYKSWVNQLNIQALHETLPNAREAYKQHLPYFIEMLQTRYGMTNTPMSAYTLGNWLVGFLQYPDSIINLSRMHQRIPQQAFREMLPEMIQMLDEMPVGREDWQHALALMALPLLASRD